QGTARRNQTRAKVFDSRAEAGTDPQRSGSWDRGDVTHGQFFFSILCRAVLRTGRAVYPVLPSLGEENPRLRRGALIWSSRRSPVLNAMRACGVCNLFGC